MVKSVKELVTAIVSLSNKNYRPLGIMPTGQDLDNLVGQFSKTVVRYVSVVKTDIKVSKSRHLLILGKSRGVRKGSREMKKC